MTNREWLERLPDEELAEFLYGCENGCNTCAYNHFCMDEYFTTCHEGIVEWLQQEHKDND